MSKIKVLHQVLDPTGAGGVSSEYKALEKSKLKDKYSFEPMILKDFQPGLNLHDILFYYKYIKRIKPDIIHIRGAAVDGLNAIIAAKLAHTGKILVTVHGMYSDLVYINPIKKWISKNIVERLSFVLADGISCVCKTAQNRSYFNSYRKKMLPFVYNRMPDYDRKNYSTYRKLVRLQYNIHENSIVALYVGRMTREKGLLVILESIKNMRQAWPKNLVFLFVGDGDYKEQMECECKKISSDIIFTGNQEEVEKFYAASDFFVQPSLHENHSISLLESAAAGIPAIATDCGGNREIVEDGVTGIIIPVGDNGSLSEAIKKMCEEKIRTRYRENISCTDYSRFSNEASDNALDEVYKLILEKKNVR